MNAGSFPANDESTFMINPAGNQDAGSGSMRQQQQRPPVSAADFNHMFSPIQLVRMFQQGGIAEENNSNSDTQNSTSIAGMLWNKHGPGDQGGGDISGSMDGAGDTLKQLMSNGSNPVDSQRRQQQRQEQQEQFMALVENESLITPSSPPETVMSPSSALDDMMSMHYQNSVTEGSLRRSSSARVAATQQSVASSMPANSSLANRRSVQYDGRNMPPIPSSPQLRPSSRMSLASYGSSNNVGNARNYAIQPPASARPSGSNDHYYYNQQPSQQRYISGRPNSSRPVPMHGVNSAAADFASHPLQIHSAVVPSTRYIQQQQQPPPPQHQLPPVPPPSQSYMQGDMSLRHEVLDKVARRSQPSTPYDVHIPPVSGSQRPPSSMAPRPGSSMDYGHPQQQQQPLFTPDDITVLPGDSRLRAYMWSQNNSQNNGDDNDSSVQPQSQQPLRQRQNQLKSSSSYTSGLNRPASSARYNSLRRNDPAALSQVRKTSDSSAHLLTPKDFNMPLPDRVGDMVLDKRIGEWVHISEYSPQMGRGDSPNMRANTSHVSSNSGYQQQQQMESPLNPTSGRSSMSIHSHASAFPQPLPTNNDGGDGASRNNHSRAGSTAIGMGLVSPVEHQQHGAVREMSERKVVRRDSAAQRRPIVDEALGSIVQRLMTPATSPDGCTALDLSGSGIRNLSGLSQLTSRLEAICLSGNKLRSLSGLPTGLVSLRAPSNWIRFSAGDADKFSFARELPHLEEIDLSANEIADISVFSGLRHLRSLELNRNRIESLGELRGCRRLILLSLRDNIVTDFDLEAAEAPLLSTLDMYNNRIRVVPASIAGFMNLMKVNMVKNDLEYVDLGGASAESVRELRLSENPLLMRRNSGVVEVGAWRAKFPNLKTLYLDICNIRQFARPVDAPSSNGASDSLSLLASPSSPSSSAASWSSLFNLSLRGNALQPLLAIDFDCLSSLKNLYAPDTQTVLPRSLPVMGHLLQLVLCNAGLTRLPSNLGAALPQLKLLDVSNNPELNDMQPLLQLASSLEVLKCRAVGFGDGSTAIPGVQVFPDVPGDSNNSNSSSFTQDSASECTLLRNLAKLRRLRRLDLRFNRCNSDLYAPPPVLASQAMQGSGAGGNGGVAGTAALSLDGALSPQMSGQGDAGAAQGLVSSARIDEEMWLRQDHTFVLNLKLARLTHLTQRRDNYWILAISLFPRLEELDGIKVGPH
ncbi:hypothetical protein LPJ53_000934 [Coemansia erecta]|uniref:L domain-like protein n=1 Tax=Coemansia erecta TaxID=147472 RepID=A0A9W7Y4J2_9FUNG|nr:hypothetical protein LPJ53_000934 [Coemansia erecta]